MRTTLAVLLLPLLFVGALHGTLAVQTESLNGGEMAGLKGAGFWTDPCTWDGFAAGIGGALCAAGSIGGCGTAWGAILKAVVVDKCF
jgi:hypothetical protein